jgi:hypothetical protein
MPEKTSAKDRAVKDREKPQDQRGAEEARHLAEEAMEEMQHGNKDEAKFLLDEARQLDKQAAEQVAQDKQKQDR